MGKQLGYPDKMTKGYWAKLGYPSAGLVFSSIEIIYSVYSNKTY